MGVKQQDALTGFPASAWALRTLGQIMDARIHLVGRYPGWRNCACIAFPSACSRTLSG